MMALLHKGGTPGRSGTDVLELGRAAEPVLVCKLGAGGAAATVISLGSQLVVTGFQFFGT